MEGMEVHYAPTSTGARVAYGVAGRGPTVIMLPATPAFGLELAIEDAAEAVGVRRLVAYDHVGSGLSEREGYDLSPHGRLDELESIVRDLDSESHTLVAVGHGGPTAIRYAVAHPERVEQLILANTWASGADYIQTGPIETFRSMIGGDPETIARTYVSVMLGLKGESAEQAEARFLDAVEPELYSARLAALGDDDVKSLLAEVSVPTTVMQGTVGIINAAIIDLAKELTAGIPGASLRIIPDLAAGTVYKHILAYLMAAPVVEWAAGGLQTILFTDVVSSTPLLTQLRDERMREVMRDHDAVCEAAITEHGGRVVKTIGDAFMAVFGVPSAAIEAAIAIQRGIRERFADSDVPVRLRIGINAGEPIVEDDDLHGASVVIAKRLESEAETDGILVSDVVRQAVAGKDFEFDDRGEVALKGFDQPVRAWAVRWDE